MGTILAPLKSLQNIYFFILLQIHTLVQQSYVKLLPYKNAYWVYYSNLKTRIYTCVYIRANCKYKRETLCKGWQFCANNTKQLRVTV